MPVKRTEHGKTATNRICKQSNFIKANIKERFYKHEIKKHNDKNKKE